MYVLTDHEEWLCKQVVECAFKVHNGLGPGLLEKIYETCFCYELSKRGIEYQRQVYLPLIYDDLTFDEGLKLDVFIDKTVVCELKAVDEVNPIWQAQILSHLKLTAKHVGFLINFNTKLIKNGIRRYCLE